MRGLNFDVNQASLGKNLCQVLVEASSKTSHKGPLIFSLIMLTHEGSHREVYREFQPTYGILLTLIPHRANNQSIGRLIKSTEHSGNT